MSPRSALSLIEVVVAAGILAVILPLVLSLFPTTLSGLRSSERMQAATTLAAYRLDEASLSRHTPGVDLHETVQLGPHRYRVVREYYALDALRLEAVVQVTCEESSLPPISLATRLARLP